MKIVIKNIKDNVTKGLNGIWSDDEFGLFWDYSSNGLN